MRNPEEDRSPEEGIAAGLFSAIPGIQAAKVAKFGKIGTVSVRAGEGAAMAVVAGALFKLELGKPWNCSG